MVSAIIVAAGKGVRMGANVDKLFLEVAGCPVVAHTWRRFDASELFQEIIIVAREELHGRFVQLASSLNLRTPYKLAGGGAERQDSVANGLEALNPKAEVVAIQDGARPCTSYAVIRRTVLAAGEVGAAVAARRVTDTIKESDDGHKVGRTLDRSRLWAVQTPQAFKVTVIRRAIQEVRNRGLVLTDDTAACEMINQPVKLVEDLEPNPKVTVPSDLPYIESLLKSQDAARA